MNKPDLKPRNVAEDAARVYRMGKINRWPGEHFEPYEFRCNDGTPIFLLSTTLLSWLDLLRSQVGPIRVNSGFRTGAYNKNVGGAKHSRHLHGLAADVVAVRRDPEEIAQWAEEEGFGGIGRYHHFTHLDVWSNNRRWDNR